MKPAIITIESEPDGSLVHTMEVEHVLGDVCIYEVIVQDGLPPREKLLFLPGEHAEAVARAILRAAGGEG
jgi:hypothetical protein